MDILEDVVEETADQDWKVNVTSDLQRINVDWIALNIKNEECSIKWEEIYKHFCKEILLILYL